MTTMIQGRPRTPSNEMQFGLHYPANLNTTPNWHQDASVVPPSQPNSSWSSPCLMQQELSPFSNDAYMSQSYSQGVGLGIDYSSFEGSHPDYLPAEEDASSIYPSQYVHGPRGNSPMTPASSSSDGVKRTRSGRSTTRSGSPQVLKGGTHNSKVSKPQRTKKPKANKTNNSRTPKLDGPLSRLTKDMSNIPVRNMEEWVHRSDETRRKEVEKRNGYVTRPMNSFMLYRSAYAERTKQWCLQNNHQVVSSVSGESWPLEPQGIRDHYNNLAKIERDNHARAHPEYKFSPSKTPNPPRKKKGDFSDEDEDEMSDAGDPDWEWRPRGERRPKGPSRRQGREAGFPAYMSPQLDFNDAHFGLGAGGGEGGDPSYPQHWGMHSDSKPLPSAMDSSDFYDTMAMFTHQQGFATPNGATPVPMHQTLAPTGIPHGRGGELRLSHSHAPMHGETQVDPTLLQVGMVDHFGHRGGGHHDMFVAGDELQSFEPSAFDASFAGDPFGVTEGMQVSQLEEWMDQHGGG